ncbi:MAG: homocysteine S-methyltransferase family protein [Deltaproteobacteria bacterium]|nr:homocysteine S-methyltransferase family protein [Deltaproteobacteria bacterium]
MIKDFRSEVKKRLILSDGAMGTVLQSKGHLPKGLLPESFNISGKISRIKEVHKSYVTAGSEIIVANTFGGNIIKLAEYGLNDKLYEVNFNAVKSAKEVAGGRALVAMSLGPTGKFIYPVGDLSFKESVEIYKKQIKAGLDAGADIFQLETMIDLQEVRSAIIAVKELCDKPVIAMMTFDKTYRTILGTTPEVFAITADSLGADVIGANCSVGPQGLYEILKKMASVTGTPLISKPNAGIPKLIDGRTVFPGKPEDFTGLLSELALIGVRVISACCGSDDSFIKALAAPLGRLNKNGLPEKGIKREEGLFLTSRTNFIACGFSHPPVIIGERINPTGKKDFIEELKNGKTNYIRKTALKQTESGAMVLDLNVGVPGTDEIELMKKGIIAATNVSNVPLSIDSSNPDVLEEALMLYPGKPLINSISGEEKKLEKIMPLVKKYGAGILILALDDAGIPETAEKRLEVAHKIYQRLIDYGIKPYDIIVDFLTLPVSAGQEKAMVTLEALARNKSSLNLPAVLGISNISFGLPKRTYINSSFLCLCLKEGLSAAIINPEDELLMANFHAMNVLSGKDFLFKKYINRFSEKAKGYADNRDKKPGSNIEKTTGEKLYDAILHGEKEHIESYIEKLSSEGVFPLDIGNKFLIPALEEVGRLFDKNIYFLPQVMESAEAMKIAFNRIKRELPRNASSLRGAKILMATVEGDVHDIGKNIVSMLLENNGYEVIDLGRNVKTEKIVEEAIKNKVDFVGLSALMTTTVAEMGRVIKELKKHNIKALSMIGGAVVTEDYAKSINADIYAKNAMEAVEKIKQRLSHSASLPVSTA